MDTLFIIIGILFAAEGAMLFTGRDFLMFRGGRQREEDYDTEGLYHAEKWLFIADAILLVAIGLTGEYGVFNMVCIVLAAATLPVHLKNFSKYRK